VIASLPEADSRSPERFRAAVMERGQPALIRGAARHWAMLADTDGGGTDVRAVADHLARFDTGRSAEVFVGAPAIGARYHYDDALTGFNFDRRTMPIRAAIEQIVASAGDAEAPTLYLGSLPAETFFPGLAATLGLAFVPAEVQPRLWIGHASSVACHYDTMDNVACVAAGRRRFTLYPPDAIGDLHVGPIDHTMAGQPVSLAEGSAPGDPRFPRFDRARSRALVVDLEPGDALYVPKLWWHKVEATGPVNILVNYWWDGFASGPDQPYSAMLLAMLAIADRPVAEREAWRAWFDHYVFRPDGHPLAFLPAERHGILASTPENRGRIRAMVMRLFRGG
jgi:hypothetical protein